MWKYIQSTGQMFAPDESLAGTGYSGRGQYKNDPAHQCTVDQGPIPMGLYTIGPGAADPQLGPIAMPLEPDSTNNMCGRSAFFIHGDSLSHPGDASDGCIILPPNVRTTINASTDRKLQVVATIFVSEMAIATTASINKPTKKMRQVRKAKVT